MKNAMSETLNTVMGTAQAAIAIPMTVVEGEEGMAFAYSAKQQLNKGISGYSKDQKKYKGKGKVVKNLLTAGAYGNIINARRKNKDYIKSMNNNARNAQHEIAIKALEKKIEKQRKDLEKIIDKKEVEKVIASANKTVSDDIILNTTYILQASLDTEIKVNLNLDSEKVSSEIDKIVNKSSDIEDLYKEIQEVNKSRELGFEIDQRKFEKNLDKELSTLIAKEQKTNKSSITKEDIEKYFGEIGKEKKVEIVKKTIKKSTSSKLNKDIRRHIESIAGEVDDIEKISKVVKDINKNTDGKVNIDKKEFEEDIKRQILRKISIEEGKRKKDITDADIEEKFKTMSEEERKELIRKSMLRNATISEEETEKINDKKTKMKLDNVNEIIDQMQEKTRSKMNGQNYKDNFERVIKQSIESEYGISEDEISKKQIDNYISNITTDELITHIKTAGAYKNSMKRDKNSNKSEYTQILNDIEKLNYHKAQMKG